MVDWLSHRRDAVASLYALLSCNMTGSLTHTHSISTQEFKYDAVQKAQPT